MDIEIPFKRHNNLTKDERDALYNLKDDPSIIIKGADKVSVVVVLGRENYLKEAYKQLDGTEVYEEVPNYPNVLINNIMKALEKIRLYGYLRYETIFCNKVVLDVKLMIFFNFNKK